MMARLPQILALAAGLGLAGQLTDPHLLPVRDWAAPLLIAAGLAGLAWTVRPRPAPSRYRWIVAAAWLALAGLAGAAWYAPDLGRAALLRAADRDPAGMAALGEHLVIGYDDIAQVRDLARRGLIGGLFVSRRNIVGKTPAALRAELAEIQALRRQAGLPLLLIATDQEGGPVSRLSPLAPRQPPLADLAGLSDAERRAADYGAEQAIALAGLGINVNFSPVVDLKPDRPPDLLDRHTRIAERAIAADPDTVSRIALAYSRALAEHGVMPTLKHFPGLGGVDADSHHFSARLATPPERLAARDWRPFRHVIERTPALLMVGHVSLDGLDPDRPASLSRKVLTGLIREQWRYDGILIGDDMSMAAVYDRGLCPASVDALDAGLDLLLIAYDWQQYYGVINCLRRAANTGDLADLSTSRARLARQPWRQADRSAP